LLLRRVRLGHLLPGGGEAVLARIRAICQPELGWDDAKWEKEEAAYRDLWHKCYSLPARDTIPDWQAMLHQARVGRAVAHPSRRKTLAKRSVLAGGLLVLALLLTWLYQRRRRA
jgi:hypothetical protein